MAPPPPPPAVFKYTFDPSLAEFNVTPQQWLDNNDKHFQGIAVANVVFKGEDDDRVLLVQRAAHDSMPNRWEVTGGAAEEDVVEGEPELSDEEKLAKAAAAGEHPRNTILSGAARELWEEAGLVATHFTHLVPQPAEAPLRDATEAPPPAYPDHKGFIYTNRTGTVLYLRFAFHVLVESTAQVTLDPNEHQDYVWANEEEVRAGMTEEMKDIPATVPATRSYILEAFRLRKLEK
ncbi:hypothetical protein Sste5346_010460 [Sporothrix stenoceras]|uniref:Nudix hydrolase domain-containing protein n=1 Tax=Sporothrix stenoceras TaxID=5173 RepID=A0ABR3YGU5_9PEZI